MAGEDSQQVGGIVVPIKADVTDLVDGLNTSKQAGQDHLDFWQGASETFAGFFGVEMVEAVKDFVKEAVQDMVRWDQTLDMTAQTLTQLGGSYTENREKLEQYGLAVQKVTQFNKTEVVQSLNQVLLRTRDYNAALKLNALAMDIVARDPAKNLQNVSAQLALAFSGNTFGLRTLSRELGVSGDKAKDAGLLFAEIEKRFNGAAAGADNAAVTFDKFKNQVAQLGEVIGSKLLPPMVQMANTFLGLTGDKVAGLEAAIVRQKALIESMRPHEAAWLGEGKAIAATSDTVIASINRQILKLHDLEVQLRTARKAAGLPGEDNGTLSGSAKYNQDHNTDDTEGQKQSDKDADMAHKARIKELQEFRDFNAEKAEIGKTSIEKIRDYYATYLDWVKKADKASGDDKQQALDAEQAAYHRYIDALKKMDEDKIKAQLEGQKAALSNAEKLAGDLADMEKAKGKEGVAVYKAFAEIKAIISTAAGVAQALSDYPYPYSLAVGALVAAEGAVEISKIEGAAAEGGMVSPGPGGRGRIIEVAEGGEPEIITPLSKVKETFGGQGGGRPIVVKEVHVHDVQTPGQFASRLPAALQRAYARQGLRLNQQGA